MASENKDLDDYVISKLNHGLLTSDIYILIKNYFNYTLSRKTFQNYIGVIRRKYKNRLKQPTDIYDDSFIKIKALNQKLQDKNRITNKVLREHDRYLNFTSELFDNILMKLDSLKHFKLKFQDTLIEIVEKTAIVQLSDLHIGEVVTLEDTLDSNEYNVEICSQRLWKYAKKVRSLLGDSVSKIVVACTGDLLNSDRRIDEMLTNADSRSETFIQAIQIISGFLLDLARYYNIEVVSVFGNESRFDQDIPYRDPIHNFDFLIHKFLSMYLSQHSDRIKFMDVSRNYEKLYNIYGKEILFFHGIKYNPTLLNRIIKKYNDLGKLVDYVISGHIHSPDIRENQGRSASVVGGNFYSTFGLNLVSNASQILYIIEKERGSIKPSIYPIIIDLQSVIDCGVYAFDHDVCKM